MKASLFIVLALSAVALAGPAFNKQNQINDSQQQQQQQQQQQYMTASGKSAAIDTLKQWCFASQMSQQELTASFKKLVGAIKSNPTDQATESAVMGERICQGALVQKSAQSGEAMSQTGADAKAQDLIKDVYMDALISCKSRDCNQQLIKIINTQQVDAVRATYYMTSIAFTEKDSIKDESEIKQLADSFVNDNSQSASEATERQKLFAVTSLIGKLVQNKPQQASNVKQTAEQVAQAIVDRYIKPVSQQEVQQYTQSAPSQQSPQLAKKIAKRNAALRALANIPGHVLKDCQYADDALIQIAQNKQDTNTARQSAIEALEQNDKAENTLKQIAFDQDEPIEVRIAAYRAIMTTAATDKKDKQQTVEQVLKHCEDSQNQQNDDQFVLYAISHLDNVRTSQQPEHAAIKEAIAKNKQHYMQIQVLNKKFKQQLSDVRRSSRNYKLEQEFNQLESGLVLEGDLIYESKQHKQNTGAYLPKLVRVNMSMPVMGETVNVVELTVRQNQMDEEVLSALKLVQGAKFNSASMSKVVDSFKSSAEKQQQNQYKNQNQQQAEADLTIKVDGCTVVYLCLDDYKSSTGSYHAGNRRNTRSVYSSYSIVDDIVNYLKRQPVSFNRGFNFNINERIAKLLDVDANVVAGLRFDSRASGHSSNDFELAVRMEPRFGFEAIVGPAKMSAKKLLQRASTKTAIGARLRFKQNELVDVQIDLPMNTMDLFTVETQLVEKSRSMPGSYSYLPDSIYGQEDIYTSAIYNDNYYRSNNKLVKRSIFSDSKRSTLGKLMSRKTVSDSLETSEKFARATGLRGKLRYAVSPKDMSVFMSAEVQKYESSMQGYRVQVQQSGRNSDQKQYLVSVSTPGSRVDRNMQVRIAKQANSQRTTLKAEIEAAKSSASVVCDLVHDGRQYAIKTEIVSRSPRSQYRHSAELGVSRSSQNAAGRLSSASYRPYLNIESSLLKRPIQLQGTVSYQQAPKTVISYELKCPTSGDYVQGKWIVDKRDNSNAYAMRKRSSMPFRRSMQSPIELLLTKDLTFTSELIARVADQAVKAHNMIDWDSKKMSVQADMLASHKNLRKSSPESAVSANMKFDAEQQEFAVEYKCPQNERKNFRVQAVSVAKPSSHDLSAEIRYNGRRQSLLAYKHKIDVQKYASNSYDSNIQVELVDTERQINEKLSGRARITADRKTKAMQCEMSSRKNSAKINVEYESLKQHQIQFALQTPRTTHKTEVRTNQRSCSVSSRTDKQGQMYAKMAAEISKQYPSEGQIVIEVPSKRAYIAADIKLASGKVSSIAVQTPRLATKAELSFDSPMSALSSTSTLFGGLIKSPNFIKNNYRFKTNIKDLLKKEAYWMDSALNVADWDKQSSYLRMDSPLYRADAEFEPRDYSAKFGAFARSKRSTNSYDSIYSARDSLINALALDSNKLSLGNNKLWMLRSIVSSPSAMESLKQKARRAFFEYADRTKQHKHSFNYSPEDNRYVFDLEHSPNTEFSSQSWEPLRMKANLANNLRSPSTLSFSSDYMSFDMDAKPYGDDESYAKISALSRHPRSTFSKHESEWRHKRGEGHKAYMKHETQRGKRHELRMQADSQPMKWTKMNYDNDKHGKTAWEHEWRKHVQKRSHDNQDVYANKWSLSHSSPTSKIAHDHSVEWDEPLSLMNRRQSSPLTSFFANVDRVHANSLTRKPRSLDSTDYDTYKADFDYEPQLNSARFNFALPSDMMHSSSIEYKPSERMYKLQSKLYNSRTQEPTYDFSAASRGLVAGMATSEQEPVFVQYDHPMFERPISGKLFANLFKQPMKLDYSDKYGRLASVDYDFSPIVADSQTAAKYSGLRQKRAALFYKDNNIEHSSLYDFYPETLFGRMKQSYKRTPGDMTIKASTKYGPVMLRTDSNANGAELELESPFVNAKASATGYSRNGAKLIKVQVDNKSQRVELSKFVRQLPIIADSYYAKKVARKFDSSRFEHETELLASIVDAIFKIKSQTYVNNRPAVVIEGEYNKQQDKAYAKINGDRVNGQVVVDLVRQSAELVLDVNDKRTLKHVTRLERTSDKFYTLESVTSHQSRPLYKLSGKVSASIFEDPSHLFASASSSYRRRSSPLSSNNAHVSTFEATVYEPKHYQVAAQYDCDKKEARVVVKNIDDNKFQETTVKYDEPSSSFLVSARLSSQYGQEYASKAKISVPGLFESDKCLRYESPYTCKSEVVYTDKSGNKWGSEYVPNEYVSMMSPRGKQTFGLSY